MREAFVVGISPLEAPDSSVVTAMIRAGALGVLDLGRDPAAAQRALTATARQVRHFGVRLPDGVTYDTLPAAVTHVIVAAGTTHQATAVTYHDQH
jgi:hypothetical protein